MRIHWFLQIAFPKEVYELCSMTNKSQQNGMYYPIQVLTTNVPPKRKRQSEDVSMITKDMKGKKVLSTVSSMSAYTTKEKEDNIIALKVVEEVHKMLTELDLGSMLG